MFGIRVACCEINSTTKKALPTQSALKAFNNFVDTHQNVRYDDILVLLPVLNPLIPQFCCGRDIEKPHITAFNRLVGVVGTPLLRRTYRCPSYHLQQSLFREKHGFGRPTMVEEIPASALI